MKKIFAAILAIICISTCSIDAGIRLHVQEKIPLGNNQQALTTFNTFYNHFEESFVWITANSKGVWGTLIVYDTDKLEPGNFYLLRRSVVSHSDEIYHGFLLATSDGIEEKPEGSLTSHQVKGNVSLPSHFSLDEAIIQLDDDRIWLIPTYQNTFKIGDIVETYTESDNLVYLIKTITIGDMSREIFIPSKRIKKGIYRIY